MAFGLESRWLVRIEWVKGSVGEGLNGIHCLERCGWAWIWWSLGLSCYDFWIEDCVVAFEAK